MSAICGKVMMTKRMQSKSQSRRVSSQLTSRSLSNLYLMTRKSPFLKSKLLIKLSRHFKSSSIQDSVLGAPYFTKGRTLEKMIASSVKTFK